MQLRLHRLSLSRLSLSHSVVVSALLCLAVGAVYFQIAWMGFVGYDDGDYVAENPEVMSGVTVHGVAWAFTQAHACNWHPLTWLSHMLDCEVYGLKAAGHHLTNVLFHAANTVLLFLLLRSLTGAVWRAACVAALFALHPLQVESVAWIAERKNVLSTFWGLACLLAYAKFARTPETDPKRRRGFYALTLVTLALGLMSKAMLVTWPCVMLLLDFWPLRRLGPSPAAAGRTGPAIWAWIDWAVLRRLVIEKLPFFALVAAVSLVTYHVQTREGMSPTLAQLTLGARVENALAAYAKYIGKLVWPQHLAVIYPLGGQQSHAASAGILAGLLAVTGLVVWQRNRRPYLLPGWAWYLGTLVPVIGLVQVGSQSMADRYMYVPAIGLLWMGVWLAGDWVQNRHRRQAAAALAAAAILLVLARMTCSQLLVWQSSEDLFRHALAVTGPNHVAYGALGRILMEDHEVRQAESFYEAALAAKPDSADAWHGLATVEVEKGRYDRAWTNCLTALQLGPNHAKALAMMGLLLAKQGQTDAAVDSYRRALKRDPNLASAHYNLANILAQRGQVQEAELHYRKSLQLQPKAADAHANLAVMLAFQRRLPEAVTEFNAALALKPGLWQARYGLADALARQGEYDAALAEFSKLLDVPAARANVQRQIDQLRQRLPAPKP
jgi:protein O-mannosyl-transferase